MVDVVPIKHTLTLILLCKPPPNNQPSRHQSSQHTQHFNSYSVPGSLLHKPTLSTSSQIKLRSSTMHFPLISQTSLLALAITLLQIPTAAGDFTLWTVDEVVMDCDLPTTCKPIQSGLWVAGGPGRDNIDHDCPDALDGTAYTADGDVLTGVTDDTTEVVFPNGLCGATGRFSCVKNGDVSNLLFVT
jgi:hypothetical protein